MKRSRLPVEAFEYNEAPEQGITEQIPAAGTTAAPRTRAFNKKRADEVSVERVMNPSGIKDEIFALIDEGALPEDFDPASAMQDPAFSVIYEGSQGMLIRRKSIALLSLALCLLMAACGAEKSGGADSLDLTDANLESVVLSPSATVDTSLRTIETPTPDLKKPAEMTEAQPSTISKQLEWLADAMNSGESGIKLQDSEMKNLNELVKITAMLPCFIEPSELEKTEILSMLYIYYQDAVRYNYDKDTYEIKNDFKYPLDGFTYDFYMEDAYVSLKKANRIINDVISINIPDIGADYGEPGESKVSVRNKTYYILMGDWWSYIYSVTNYQYIGDGMYYLVFSGDNTDWMWADDEKGETIKDFCRMVVKRSESAWGFTIISKLKYADSTLLPDDFPLPKIGV